MRVRQLQIQQNTFVVHCRSFARLYGAWTDTFRPPVDFPMTSPKYRGRAVRHPPVFQANAELTSDVLAKVLQVIDIILINLNPLFRVLV
jgi:hypothetical protein